MRFFVRHYLGVLSAFNPKCLALKKIYLLRFWLCNYTRFFLLHQAYLLPLAVLLIWLFGDLRLRETTAPSHSSFSNCLSLNRSSWLHEVEVQSQTMLRADNSQSVEMFPPKGAHAFPEIPGFWWKLNVKSTLPRERERWTYLYGTSEHYAVQFSKRRRNECIIRPEVTGT